MSDRENETTHPESPSRLPERESLPAPGPAPGGLTKAFEPDISDIQRLALGTAGGMSSPRPSIASWAPAAVNLHPRSDEPAKTVLPRAESSAEW